MTILTLQDQGRLRPLVADTVPVVAVGAAQLRSAGPALRRTLAAVRPRVLLSSEAAANCVAFLAARSLPKASRPVILLREVTSPSMARTVDPYLQNRLAYRIIGHVYARADRTITLTEGARNDLVANFGVPAARIAVMRSNAVLDPATEQRLAACAAAPPQREPGLIVCMGRLSPEKDQLTLVEALRHMATRRPTRLVLVGDGPMQDDIARRAAELGLADRVVLAGHCADPFSWLLKAELAVCSSRFEGLGNALIEAMACGTPVVSTDCPWGPREILQDGRLGALAPVGDPSALAAAMDRQLATAPDREALRLRAANYTAERAAEAFLAIVAAAAPRV